VLRLVGKPESLIQFVTDRPGHDRRYAIDCSRIHDELGWSAQVGFSEGLAETVAWYRERADWVDEIRDATYLSYYERMYTNRDRTLQEK
jgi:dTDP-glucose 4,6-dehydratase